MEDFLYMDKHDYIKQFKHPERVKTNVYYTVQCVQVAEAIDTAKLELAEDWKSKYQQI